MTTVSSASPALTGNDPENRLFGPLPDVAGGGRLRARTTRRGSASSPTPRCASAARPARWPARSGTRSRWTTRTAPATRSGLSGMSYDNTGHARGELVAARGVRRAEPARSTCRCRRSACPARGGTTGPRPRGRTLAGAASVLNAEALSEFDPQTAQSGDREIRWLMSSDVCKHCTHAGCLDVCPTGALFRTEFGTVVVQQDICNGCGYCVPACPYGVIDQRKDDGRVFKCTMCYDRLTDGLQPACATACPTQSIQFGDLDELQARADARLATLQGAGRGDARGSYGRDENDGVGGSGGVLPAARRAGGLRPAAGPDRDHPRPAGDVEVGRRGRGDDRRGRRCRRPRLAEALTVTEGIATPGAGWRRADGRARRKKKRARGKGAAAAAGAGRAEVADGRRRRVHLVLRAADHQGAGVEDARRAAVPVPGWSGGVVGDPGRAGRPDRPAGADAGRPG